MSADAPLRIAIVGAGSCGGILAERLSASGHEVVLFEAGPDYGPLPNWPEPLLAAVNPQLTGHDWGYDATMVEAAARRTPYPRGKVLGGSSVINGVVGQRGLPEDYDTWEATTGSGPGWSAEALAGAFERLEASIPISRVAPDTWPSLFQALTADARTLGLPWHDDRRSATAGGVGPLPRNQRAGRRASSVTAYVEHARHRRNLTIVADASVERIEFDGTTAVGVMTAAQTLECDRVILSAGVIGSPLLLWRSGIGSLDHVDAPVSELRGVGRNLLDHPRVALILPRDGGFDGAKGIMGEIRWSSLVGTSGDSAIFLSVLERAALAGDSDAEEAAMLSCSLMAPTSRGWIEPGPDIHMNFLATQEDRERLRGIVERACALALPHAGGLDVSMLPDTATRSDVDAFDRWIAARVRTGYHGVGTCRMGPAEDADAVVDGWLAVHGVDGLYVADASVIPRIPAAPTNLSCYALAEHAAGWLGEVRVAA